MYSREEVAAAARNRGYSEDQIKKIFDTVDLLKQAGLVKTGGRGANLGLTRAGAKKLAELRASGQIPPR